MLEDKEFEFNRKLVDDYFKYGSVEAVIRKYRYNLPVSPASYYRVLHKWQVIKTAGPNNKITEILGFLTHLAEDNIEITDLYKKMPPGFQTSLTSIHRILSYVKEGLTRRVGTALIITPFDNQRKILIARDISVPRIELGKPFGSYSLPMGYSRKRDSREINVSRVLQQEVFTQFVVNRIFPNEILQDYPEPFMFLDIVDVRVAVYHITLSKKLSTISSFSSYKLRDYSFIDIDRIDKIYLDNLRIGVREAISGYKKHLKLLNRNLKVNPIYEKSILNYELGKVTLEI